MGTHKRKKQAAAETDDDTQKSGAPRPDEMPPDVIEFITAIDEYKRTHRRPFPNWSEVLGILKALGYERARS